jgi:undecaprenyl-diphosphatase
MTVWQGILLGLVQGVTEFLPVSSDGHLVLVGSLAGVTTPGVFVEVALHVATLGAVLVVYGRRLAAIALGAARGRAADLRSVALLALGTAPAAVIGLLFKPLLERTFDSLWFAGAGFLFTGTLLWTTRRARLDDGGTREGEERSAPSPVAAVVIGVAQALAILPGVSRSGSTVSVALWARVRPIDAAEFSFLLAVPAIAGAAVLEAPEAAASVGAAGIAPLIVSCAVAFASGLWAIRFLLTVLQRGRFHVFAPYCWGVGVFTLLVALWRA